MSINQCPGKDPGHCNRIHWNFRDPPLHQTQVYNVTVTFRVFKPDLPKPELHANYGKPRIIARAHIDRLSNGAKIKPTDW